MINSGDAWSAIHAQYNRRLAPKGARPINSLSLNMEAILNKQINWNNLWVNTLDGLKEWSHRHGVIDQLDGSLYTWAIRNNETDTVLMILYIYWHDRDIQTMFDISANFRTVIL
jgi:hypothetical protein